MTLGPVEIVTIVFPENKFTGAILPELSHVVESGTISIIDGLFVTIDEDGIPAYYEFDELDQNDDVASLVSVLQRVEGLLSDDDVAQLTETLEPNSSAAILVFEHTWVKPLRDTIVAAGGVLVESIRIPGAVVSEVQAAVAEMIDD
jgi:hypothetical protein